MITVIIINVLSSRLLKVKRSNTIQFFIRVYLRKLWCYKVNNLKL